MKWLILLLLFLPAVAFASDPEARCVELGISKTNGCFCAEAFNEGFARFGKTFNGTLHFDMPASPDSSECTGEKNSGALTCSAANCEGLDPAGAFGKPLNGVDFVSVTRGIGISHIRNATGNPNSWPVSGNTTCVRSYQTAAPGLPRPKGGDRFKVMTLGLTPTITDNNDKTFQWAWGGGNSVLHAALDGPDWGRGQGGQTNWSSGWDMNEANWKRLEVCGDHNPATGLVTARGRVCRISYAGVATECKDSIVRTFTTSSSSDAYLGTASDTYAGFTQNTEGSMGSIGANTMVRAISHHMVATIPYNPAFWIGPAIEIEGGSGGGVPPPPPPAAPAPPFLLE